MRAKVSVPPLKNVRFPAFNVYLHQGNVFHIDGYLVKSRHADLHTTAMRPIQSGDAAAV